MKDYQADQTFLVAAMKVEAVIRILFGQRLPVFGPIYTLLPSATLSVPSDHSAQQPIFHLFCWLARNESGCYQLTSQLGKGTLFLPCTRGWAVVPQQPRAPTSAPFTLLDASKNNQVAIKREQAVAKYTGSVSPVPVLYKQLPREREERGKDRGKGNLCIVLNSACLKCK